MNTRMWIKCIRWGSLLQVELRTWTTLMLSTTILIRWPFHWRPNRSAAITTGINSLTAMESAWRVPEDQLANEVGTVGSPSRHYITRDLKRHRLGWTVAAVRRYPKAWRLHSMHPRKKCKRPVRLWRAHLEMTLWPKQWDKVSLRFNSLSASRCSCKVRVSTSMPKNVIQVAGPSTSREHPRDNPYWVDVNVRRTVADRNSQWSL